MRVPKTIKCIAKLFFNHRCKNCGKELFSNETELCKPCVEKLPRTMFELDKDNDVAKMLWGRELVEFAFAGYYFHKNGVIQSLIHDFKYNKATELAFRLGMELGKMLQESKNTDYDIIVPVPLHPKKQRMRGYNQSDYIAEGISKITNIPVEKHLLIRTVYKDSQTHKTRELRWTSIQNNFDLYGDIDRWIGYKILLVDDVITTGATTESCCKALHKIPDVTLGVAAIAVARGD